MILLLWLYRHIMPSNIPHNHVWEIFITDMMYFTQGWSCSYHYNLSLLHPKLHYAFCFPFKVLFLIPTRCMKIECAILQKPEPPKFWAYLINILCFRQGVYENTFILLYYDLWIDDWCVECIVLVKTTIMIKIYNDSLH